MSVFRSILRLLKTGSERLDLVAKDARQAANLSSTALEQTRVLRSEVKTVVGEVTRLTSQMAVVTEQTREGLRLVQTTERLTTERAHFQKLATENRAETVRWKLKSREQGARTDSLKQVIARRGEDLNARESQLNSTRFALDVRRRAALNPGVLRGVLQARARDLPLTLQDREAARIRESRLLEASASYREAKEQGVAGRTAGLQRVEMEGIGWWVPVDERMPDRVPRAQRQGLPFKAILQSRELAIGGVMLDLGANIGRTSIARVLLGDVRAVYAAEPDPANYTCLVQNMAEHHLEGLVLPDQVAIAAQRGEVQLQRSKYIGGHRVLHGVAVAATEKVVTVPAYSVDEWMAKLGIEREAITFVKVDVQGSEVGVLRGAGSLLARRHVAWYIEVDPKLLDSAGTSTAELCALFETHFSHFIDVGTDQPGDRVQPTAALREALGYVGVSQTKTDLLLYNA